jgi:hypothetical protein
LVTLSRTHATIKKRHQRARWVTPLAGFAFHLWIGGGGY